MKQFKLQDMTADQLVKLFESIALQQDEALLRNELTRFNSLYRQMNEVENELRVRAGDQRHLLVSLYDHPNAQVRLKAAARSLAVVPAQARRLLEVIANSQQYPQAGDAGMLLAGLDDGTFRPT
jgi:hypothetical protein